MKDKVVSATEFRARCLALIDEVDKYGITVTVTKRGKPAGLLEPINRRRKRLTRESNSNANDQRYRVQSELFSSPQSG
jgi:prevent-host-death family protein